jgi:tetraacyldisaccharide 4'-kinase
VTVDPLEWAGEEKLLPRGCWREPKSAIQRAHAACVQEKPGVTIPSLPIPTFYVKTSLDGIYKGCDRIDHHLLVQQSVVAFAGIAKPGRFFEAIECMGIPLKRRIEFRDHHAYTPQDAANIAEAGENQTLITTEKDSVRLAGSGIRDFLHLRISANISEFDRLMELIQSRFS